MSTGITTTHEDAMRDDQLLVVLQSSLYPGASIDSLKMVLGYCKAAGLDPLQKPVHIVPMWDSKAKAMRDVVMPGIGLYRVQAARSNAYAGITEPEFGPDVTEAIGGVQITYPAWCKVTVKRRLPDGTVADFTAVERWKENYAIKGGADKSIAPNAMWTKRPYGQIAKCAQAQALRMAFPEIGSQPTAEEMEGKSLDGDQIERPTVSMPKAIDETPKDQTIELASVGQMKWIENKCKSLGLDHLTMLAEQNVNLEAVTVDDFQRVKAHLLSC